MVDDRAEFFSRPTTPGSFPSEPAPPYALLARSTADGGNGEGEGTAVEVVVDCKNCEKNKCSSSTQGKSCYPEINRMKLTSEQMAMHCLQRPSGFPTIFLNSPVRSKENSLLESIQQPCLQRFNLQPVIQARRFLFLTISPNLPAWSMDACLPDCTR